LYLSPLVFSAYGIVEAPVDTGDANVNLEPEVIASITRHKRKVFLLKFFMVAVIALALVLSVAL